MYFRRYDLGGKDSTDATAFAYAEKKKPLTNADKIRQMSDEELAKFLGSIIHDYGQGTAEIEGAGYVIDDWLDWLKEEATE